MRFVICDAVAASLKIESDVEHLKTDVAHLKVEVRELRTDFHSFKVEVIREFGLLKAQMAQGFGRVDKEIEWLRTAVEQSKRWMLVTGIGLVATSVGTLATLGRMMRWF